MPKITMSPIEIYKTLNKSNCGDCSVKTCFAFASLVSRGSKEITDCPHLSGEAVLRFGSNVEKKKSVEEEQEESLKELEKSVTEIDFAGIAENLGATFKNNTLIIKCLGKNFFIDTQGHVSSEIHVHSWIKIPLLSYIIKKSNTKLTDNWVRFRQLPGGEKWNPLYMQRCEKPLLKIADTNHGLFFCVLSLFGKEVHIDGIIADITVKLYPLPKVPLLLCYSQPEEGFESQLTFYYDQNTEKILNMESIYLLATGISIMVEKIVIRHSI